MKIRYRFEGGGETMITISEAAYRWGVHERVIVEVARREGIRLVTVGYGIGEPEVCIPREEYFKLRSAVMRWKYRRFSDKIRLRG